MTETKGTTLLDHLLGQAERFQREIIGIPIPETPRLMGKERIEYAAGHLREEVDEFEEKAKAGDAEGALDGLIDLIYVALGRIVEMGVLPGPAFAAVHEANMARVRGDVSKRPSSLGYDAVKPPGWKAPDLTPFLTITTTDVSRLLGDLSWVPYVSPVHKIIAELRRQKGQDYNTGIDLKDYFPFGHYSYAQMIHLKDTRIKSLLAVIASGKEPNFEGLDDTVLDLINYATFYAEWLRDEKAKKGKKAEADPCT